MKFPTLASLVSLLIPLASPAQSPSDSLAKIDPRVTPAGSPEARLLAEELTTRWSAERKARSAEAYRTWAQLDSLEAWTRFRAETLERLRDSLGTLPGPLDHPPAKLRRKVTRVRPGQGYQVENLLYESRPGFWVSANLYRPEPLPKSPLAFLLSHSHHNPKTEGELQDIGVTLSKAGCLVLVPDHAGHGERRDHPFSSEKDYPGPFRVGRQDYYFRANLGAQLDLAGLSLLGVLVWDLSRGVDLLLERGADPKKVILMGAVAGGGDPAGVCAALDSRISCVVPFNFGGTQPDYTTPKEPERNFYWFGSAYWETTRGLRNEVPHWAVVASVAPRRVIYAHEFAWQRDQDPAFPFIEKVFAWHKVPEHLVIVQGQGNLKGRPPESSHCNNIGPLHRERIYPHLKSWFGIPIPTEVRERVPASDLLCWTPELRKELAPLAIHAFARAEAEKTLATLRAVAVPDDMKLSVSLARWQAVLGDPPLKPKFRHDPISTVSQETYEVRKVLLRRSTLAAGPGSTIPLLILIPKLAAGQKASIVLGLAHGGKAGFLAQEQQAIADLLNRGAAVCLPDLTGWGERANGSGRRYSSESSSQSQFAWMLGKTVLGEQLADARCVVQYLKNLPELDSTQLSFWGASHARRNTADTRFSVPLEVDPAPAFVEPAGGLLALLLGLTEPNRGVLVDRLPVSYLSALDSAILMYPHDSLARNFFAAGDVPDLVQVLAHTPITWREPVDGRQVPLNAAARTRLSDHLVRARGAGKPLRILGADGEGPADVLLERK